MRERRYQIRRTTDPDHVGTMLELVSQATSKALDKRRKRLYAECAVLAILVALVVAVPTSIIETHAANSNAAEQRNYNCRVASFVAAVLGNGNGLKALPKGGFISSDAYLRHQQAMLQSKTHGGGALVELLRDPQTKRLQIRSIALNTQTINYWNHTLIPYLNEVARANCSRVGG